MFILHGWSYISQSSDHTVLTQKAFYETQYIMHAEYKYSQKNVFFVSNQIKSEGFETFCS